ncbi:MAG: zf-HC2 domain-containing protein [Acidobacteriaceae bacterium]|nr:zf-HC2 domain-containing protein [Acidobacteriaceae bacterium]MBV9767025.1 zf-HC2 domain-containing protein [Acidobacteriaceae bacterium]
MTKSDHLPNDSLLRAIDDELAGTEVVLVESHLQRCEECRRSYQELSHASARIESVLAAVPIEHYPEERERLAEELERCQTKTNLQGSEKVLRRFGWGMAIAATLAIGVLLLPGRHARIPNTTGVSEARSSAALQVDGETFIPLPYSNPELPVSASHIVEMRISASSLADAGIVFEPISNTASEQDSSVLADVLLGMDGQPLGVHVLRQ